MTENITIANATTATECRCWIGIICIGAAANIPPFSRWDWLVSPFSTPATRKIAFEEIKPHLLQKDADNLASLLDRLNQAETA